LAQIFPRWANKIPTYAAISIGIIAFAVIGFFWYYGSPKYTDVGYRPIQPIPYSHKLHAGDLGLDCRYCHYDIEYSPAANVPPTAVCMNCHKIIGTDNEKLLKVRESFASRQPIHWIRVHKLPDYAYFDHRMHLWAGVGCSSCHGNVAQMEVVGQVAPLSMSWCLDCHRNPDKALRTADQVTNMNWTPPDNQIEIAARLKTEKKIEPPTDCSGCHR
jgi:hypothetical protein